MELRRPSLLGECSAEFIGTYILVLLGDTAVAVAVFTGGYDLAGVAMIVGCGCRVGRLRSGRRIGRAPESCRERCSCGMAEVSRTKIVSLYFLSGSRRLRRGAHDLSVLARNVGADRDPLRRPCG